MVPLEVSGGLVAVVYNALPGCDGGATKGLNVAALKLEMALPCILVDGE